jgi:hypothetical protein
MSPGRASSAFRFLLSLTIVNHHRDVTVRAHVNLLATNPQNALIGLRRPEPFRGFAPITAM